MIGSNGVQLFRTTAAMGCADRADSRLPLRSEHFPVQARGSDIVTDQGVVIATAANPALGEEIARRLNESDFRSQEDQWAL
jgi:hypothetical protein